MNKNASYLTINSIVFVIELLLSLSIGIYYATRQKSSSAYIHGDKGLSLLPVILSYAVTYTSAISIQGIPAEVYVHGIEILSFSIAYCISACIAAFTFVPLFYELKLTSVFEYFMMRYNSRFIYLFACIISCIRMMVYSSLVILGPSEALESILGIPVQYCIIILSSVCIIYTSVGGIQGVIWTDVLQSMIMIVGLFVLLIFGSLQVGFGTAWQQLEHHQRTTLHYNPSMWQRTSVWFMFYHLLPGLYSTTYPSSVLRYGGLKTLNQAKLSVVFAYLGVLFFDLLIMAVGIVIFGYYANSGCGPLEDNHISSANQILPFFIIDVLNYPGIPGLFVSILAAGALSSASSNLNASAISFLKDVILPVFPQLSDYKKTNLLKLLVVLFGFISIAFTFLFKYAKGSIYQISTACMSILAAPIGSAFLLGALIPTTSSKSIIISSFCSLAISLWISLGNLIHGIHWESSSSIDESCLVTSNTSSISYFNNNTTSSNNGQENTSNNFLIHLYSISPYTYGFINAIVMLTIGSVLTLIPYFRNTEPVDSKLLFHFVRKYYTTQAATIEKSVVQDSKTVEIDSEMPILS